jgi:endo-1,4-beta-xylanase
MTREMMSYKNGMSRRTLLRNVAFSAGAGALGSLSALAMLPSLRETAAIKGLPFGCAISSDLFRNSILANVVKNQCSIAVPENALKWAATRPTLETFDFSGSDALWDFAQTNKMLFRGHTLVWHGSVPTWFDGAVNATNAEIVMQKHISTVMRHYAGKIHSWDVVNEAVWIPDRRPDGLRITPWLKFLGPGYIAMAFHAAHEADPSAELVYNDYFLESEDANGEAKRRAVWTMLAELKKAGVPIHALGIQSHLVGSANVTGPNFKRFLSDISHLGLNILITEMDVDDRTLPADVAVRDRLVANQYFNYLSFVLQFACTKAVLTWGLSDRYTWLRYSHQRFDGLPNRPLPYDDDLKPTPSWYAIQRALEEVPAR